MCNYVLISKKYVTLQKFERIRFKNCLSNSIDEKVFYSVFRCCTADVLLYGEKGGSDG